MSRTRIGMVAALLALSVGCGTEEPTADQSEQVGHLAAKVKAIVTDIDASPGNILTKTATAKFLNVTGTSTSTVTLRNDYVAAKPVVWTATLTRNETAPRTFNGTGTASGTFVDSGTTYTGTGTTSSLMQFSSFPTLTSTKTVAARYTGALSDTVIGTGTGYGWSGSITWTYTKTSTSTAH
jgi:hypothetical protein